MHSTFRLARNAGAWLAHNNLGNLLLPGPSGRSEALAHFQAALRLEFTAVIRLQNRAIKGDATQPLAVAGSEDRMKMVVSAVSRIPVFAGTIVKNDPRTDGDDVEGGGPSSRSRRTKPRC